MAGNIPVFTTGSRHVSVFFQTTLHAPKRRDYGALRAGIRARLCDEELTRLLRSRAELKFTRSTGTKHVHYQLIREAIDSKPRFITNCFICAQLIALAIMKESIKVRTTLLFTAVTLVSHR